MFYESKSKVILGSLLFQSAASVNMIKCISKFLSNKMLSLNISYVVSNTVSNF